ncbi:MAG: chemotaxis-specific protein-glutamate methyltransferase CheB [Phycisphaerae bacterium]
MATRSIRTLVVDDSAFMRTMLKNALSQSPETEVIGSAPNGREALDKIQHLKPDVVTLNIEMPGLSGIDVITQVMNSDPVPIVMVSTKTLQGAQLTFDALERGAVDYVAQPHADKPSSLDRFHHNVIRAVVAAHATDRNRLGSIACTTIRTPRPIANPHAGLVVAIGVGAGGPATLHRLMPAMPKDFPPLLVTQHMPADFTGPFARRLDRAAHLDVREARRGDALAPGTMLIAPGGQHMRVVRRHGALRVAFERTAKVAGSRPSVDVLFDSVAGAVGANAIGLVMTGMGDDGADGICKLKAAGARTLAQDHASSIVYGMPKAALDTGCVDRVVALSDIPHILCDMISRTEQTAVARAAAN